MSESYERGVAGEKAVCCYLVKNGGIILKTNYHSRFGEIDIIAQSGENLCFIEVKTRWEDSLGAPCEAVGISKQRKIILTALTFIEENKLSLQPRFDVVEVICRRSAKLDVKEMRVYKNAFDANEKNTKGMNF